jgi:hypothetical protein
MDEVLPYLKVREREMLFREGVMNFIGVGQEERLEKQDEDDYQAAVRMAEAKRKENEPQA